MDPEGKQVKPQSGSTRGSETFEAGKQYLCTPVASKVKNKSKIKYETPPVFDPENTMYEEWRISLGDWCHITGTALEDQGTAVRMNLLGTAKQAAQNVSTEDIRSIHGVKKVVEELDKVFIPEAMVWETTARKLHLKFGHPTPEALIKIMKQDNLHTKKAFEKEVHSVSNNCVICIQYKKTNPKPVIQGVQNSFQKVKVI